MVKQTISVRSGNWRRPENAAAASFGVLPVPKIELLITQSSSIPPLNRPSACSCRICKNGIHRIQSRLLRFHDQSFARATEHGHFALAIFSGATREVVCNPSFGIGKFGSIFSMLMRRARHAVHGGDCVGSFLLVVCPGEFRQTYRC